MLECITTHAETQVKAKPWDRIHCLECREILSYQEMVENASEDAAEM